MPLPSQSENPKGLHQRYNVTKVDGENDPRAIYIVLRIDRAGDDEDWLKACRKAAAQLADLTARSHPKLSSDLKNLLWDIESTYVHP